MSPARWLILIILSAAITAALFTAVDAVVIPKHDIDGFELQAALATYAFAIVLLAIVFLVLGVPVTVLLERAGLANWPNLVIAGGLIGANLGLVAYVFGGGTGPTPLYTWWRLRGWGAAAGALSAGIWAALKPRFRGA